MKRIIYLIIFLITAFFLSSNLFAQTNEKEEVVTPAATAEYSNSFVKILEDIELKYIEGKKHWRKGDYPLLCQEKIDDCCFYFNEISIGGKVVDWQDISIFSQDRIGSVRTNYIDRERR